MSDSKPSLVSWVHYNTLSTRIQFPANVTYYDDLITPIRLSPQLSIPPKPIYLYTSNPDNNNNAQPIDATTPITVPLPKDIYVSIPSSLASWVHYNTLSTIIQFPVNVAYYENLKEEIISRFKLETTPPYVNLFCSNPDNNNNTQPIDVATPITGSLPKDIYVRLVPILSTRSPTNSTVVSIKNFTSFKEYTNNDKPFVDRDSFYHKAAQISFNNYYNRLSTTAQYHHFVMIPGGSGIGKTRAGEEFCNIPESFLAEISQSDNKFIEAMKNPIYCYINLNNGFRCTETLDYSNHHSINSNIAIGVRVAASQITSVNNFPEFQNKYIYKEFFLSNVIKKLLENRKCHYQQQQQQQQEVTTIIIHLDEYQIYIKDIQQNCNKTFEEARAIFKDMLRDIGSCMQSTSENHGNFFIIPICTGTSARDLHFLPTEYCTDEINLLPLKQNQCQDIYQTYLKDKSLLEKEYFQILLGDTGFIPRYLIDFLSYANVNPTSPGNLFYEDLVTKWKNIKYYTDIKFVYEFMLLMSLTNTKVELSFKIPNTPFIVDDVRRFGILFLTKNNPNDDKLFNIFIPFVMLRWLNIQIDIPLIDPSLLFIPTSVQAWTWQSFESLYPQYQTALIKSLKYHRGENEKINLSQIFRSSDGSNLLPNVDLDPQSLPINSIQDKKTENIFEMDTPAVYICSTNCKSIDHRSLFKDKSGNTHFAFIQVKHKQSKSETENLTPKTISYWYTTFLTDVCHTQDMDCDSNCIGTCSREKSMILLLFTNKKISNPQKELDLFAEFCSENELTNKYLLLIHKDNLSDFLSPSFSHRGLLQFDEILDSPEYYSTQPMDLE